MWLGLVRLISFLQVLKLLGELSLIASKSGCLCAPRIGGPVMYFTSCGLCRKIPYAPLVLVACVAIAAMFYQPAAGQVNRTPQPTPELSARLETLRLMLTRLQTIEYKGT